jgi:hypothetical protein
MSQRFSYVKYDEESQKVQETLKSAFEMVEHLVSGLPSSREKALCITALEEAYMWTGKAIRDHQIARYSMNQCAQKEAKGFNEHRPERG